MKLRDYAVKKSLCPVSGLGVKVVIHYLLTASKQVGRIGGIHRILYQ